MWDDIARGQVLHLREIGDGQSDHLRSIEVIGRVSQSGTSVVYKVFAGSLGDCALKIFQSPYKPSLTADADDQSLQDALDRDREAEALERIGGTVAPRLHAVGHLEYPDTESSMVSPPVLLMEFVEGETLTAWLPLHPTFDERFRVLASVAAALDQIHSQGVLQIDVADRNVLVRNDSSVTLVDFNASKVIRPAGPGRNETTLARLRNMVSLPAGHVLSRPTITYDELARHGLPSLDLFGFGELTQSVLHDSISSVPLRSRRALEYLIRELREWDTLETWPKGELELRWSRCAHGIDRLPELAPPSKNNQSIALPGGLTAAITTRLDRVIGCPQFFRLGHLRQLSLVDYIYPGATHTRRTHLLHSLEITRQLVNQLKDSPAFEVHFGHEDALRLLATSLLHDLNHFPFLHNIQESVGDLLPNEQVLNTIIAPSNYPAGSGAEDFLPALAELHLDPARLYGLCFGKHTSQSSPSDEVISSIVNSGVDIDKISYLLLDGHATGVAYASGLDLSTLLKSATVARRPQSPRLHLAFEDRALQAMEHVYLTRLWNFRSIYWHHTNRALMAMVGSVSGTLFAASDEPEALFEKYFRETLVGGEPVAAQWLSDQFDAAFPGTPNAIRNLMLDRRQMFKRLYTVRPELGGEDREVYATLSSRLLPLSGMRYVEAEQQLKDSIAAGLKTELGGLSASGIIPASDILVDLPRRRLDEGGDSFVLRPDGQAMHLAEASSIVRHISEDYEKLAKRVRVFVSPRLAAALPSGFRVSHRDRLQKVVAHAVEALPAPKEGPK